MNAPTTTGGTNASAAPYDKTTILLTKVTVVNKTAGAVTVTLFLGATGANAAGSEFLFNALSIPANSSVERYCRVPLSTADFIVGGASANTSLSVMFEGEIYIGA